MLCIRSMKSYRSLNKPRLWILICATSCRGMQKPRPALLYGSWRRYPESGISAAAMSEIPYKSRISKKRFEFRPGRKIYESAIGSLHTFIINIDFSIKVWERDRNKEHGGNYSISSTVETVRCSEYFELGRNRQFEGFIYLSCLSNRISLGRFTETALSHRLVFSNLKSVSDFRHRYNLKRKIAELPPVTAEVFAQKVLGKFLHWNSLLTHFSSARSTAIICFASKLLTDLSCMQKDFLLSEFIQQSPSFKTA